MKYLLLFAVITVAIFEPWTNEDLVYHQLERRGFGRETTGRSGHRKMSVRVTRTMSVPPDGKKGHPPESPPRDSDTRVSGAVKGPGRVGVLREKWQRAGYTMDAHEASSGEPHRKETHDANWSEAEVHTDGNPSSRAASQPAVLHEARVQGSGQNGHVRVTPPHNGGYGKLKKEVNGVVVKDQRIPPGQVVRDDHVGTRPGEVKYTASSSRGGEVHVSVDNPPRPSA